MAENKRRPRRDQGRKEQDTALDRDEGDLSPEAVRRMWDQLCRTKSDRICLNCLNMVWPKRLDGHGRWQARYPVCVDHTDSPGSPREVHPAATCPHFRPRPQPPLRVQPPAPARSTDRYIPLTRGLWTVVHVADFEWLSRHHWYASPSGDGKMYARRNTRTSTVLMHREIMHAPKGKVVDHRDRNGLNNRPDNLRLCTRAQNQYNKAPRGKTSRFKNVYRDGDRWYSVIKHKGKTYYLGTFTDEVEAAKARDRKAYDLEGEFAYLNFPQEFQAQPPAKSEGKPRRSGPAKDPARRKKRKRK